MNILDMITDVKAAYAKIEAAINEVVKDAAGEGETLRLIDVYTNSAPYYIQLSGSAALMTALAKALGTALIRDARHGGAKPISLSVTVDGVEILALYSKEEAGLI